jgi:hypothetical protein
VADEHDRHAVGAQPADHVEQHLRLAVAERGCGFVHDHQPGRESDGARDRHHLLRRGREIMQRAAHVDRNAEPGQQRRRLLVHPRPVEQPEAAFLAAEADVLGDRAIADEIDLLIDRADSGVLAGERGSNLERSPGERHLAGVTAVIAGENLDERRFAGAVLADQRVHLARRHREFGVGERGDAGELLVDAAHREQGRCVGHRVHPHAIRAPTLPAPGRR